MWTSYVATLALGSQPKQKVCKVAGQERSSGVTPHAPGTAKKCEGMNPHTPKATPTLGNGVMVDFRWTLETSKADYRGQNSMV